MIISVLHYLLFIQSCVANSSFETVINFLCFRHWWHNALLHFTLYSQGEFMIFISFQN